MVAAIPDRWLLYKECGKIIEGTRIICFKVPLKRVVQIKNADIKEIWDVGAVLKKIPKLGAIVDLTNTARYYDPKKFMAAGICHKKILMPGRIIPPEDKVTEFIKAVDAFLEKDDELLVGVHCTHGLNRTGYMVCRYMRDRLGMPASDAIRRFELARGYQIERDNYIADLLGKTPPPPDIGPDTKVKPINNRKSVTHQKIARKNNRWDQEAKKFDKNRKFENKPFEEGRSKRKNDRTISDRSDRSGGSYNFKFDY